MHGGRTTPGRRMPGRHWPCGRRMTATMLDLASGNCSFRPFTCDTEIRRRTIWRSHRMSAPGIHGTRSLPAMSQPEGFETNNFRSIQRELSHGLMNPQHLELLSDRSDLYRHLITFTLTQHSPAQGGFAADDLDDLRAVEQLHVPPIRAQKDLLLLVV